MCDKILKPFFEKSEGKTYKVSISWQAPFMILTLSSQYKVELRVRNHTKLTRPEIINTIAACVPEGHTVDLTDPQVFILVEVFKVCWACIMELERLLTETLGCMWYVGSRELLWLRKVQRGGNCFEESNIGEVSGGIDSGRSFYIRAYNPSEIKRNKTSQNSERSRVRIFPSQGIR